MARPLDYPDARIDGVLHFEEERPVAAMLGRPAGSRRPEAAPVRLTRSSPFQAGVRAPASGYLTQRFRHWSCGDRDRGDSRLPSPMLRWMFRKSASSRLDIYLPHRADAWYSSAGMDRNYPVFIGGALWVCSWETPFSRHQCIQDNRAGVR